jgi:hypothetical protein
MTPMDGVVLWVVGSIVSVPIGIVAYCIFIGIMAVPAVVLAAGAKLVKPDSKFADLFESSFTLLIFLYLLGLPITFYFFWGWSLFIERLMAGAFLEALLTWIICPLVPFSIMMFAGFLISRFHPTFRDIERERARLERERGS